MLRIRTRLAGWGLIAAASGCVGPKMALVSELDRTRARLLVMEVELAAKDEHNEQLSGELEVVRRETLKIERNSLALADEVQLHRATLRELEADRELELEVYNQLANALQALLDAELVELVPRRGQMMVELQESVLFSSGQAKLTSSGKQTLGQVTQALLSLPDRRFMIAGHTDDVPLRPGRYKDNLELSSERASAVLRFMVKRGLARQRVSAVGYDDIDPLESNETPEGRAKNRRVEIILLRTWSPPTRPPPCRELDPTDD